MAKDTSTRSGEAGSATTRRPKRADRPPPGRKPTKAIVDARADAQRIRREAESDAARTRAEAEEHARRLVLDARASADGVRAEAMELVSILRQLSDVLRSNAELLSDDIEQLHLRMVGELAQVDPGDPEPRSAVADEDDHQLAVPDFVSHR